MAFLSMVQQAILYMSLSSPKVWEENFSCADCDILLLITPMRCPPPRPQLCQEPHNAGRARLKALVAKEDLGYKACDVSVSALLLLWLIAGAL